MAKKKSKKKSSSKGKTSKSKPSKKVVERTYSFPSLGKSVKAKSRKEALKKVS
jgi:hypothetical protein